MRVLSPGTRALLSVTGLAVDACESQLIPIPQQVYGGTETFECSVQSETLEHDMEI
jgi:hypothetical protein